MIKRFKAYIICNLDSSDAYYHRINAGPAIYTLIDTKNIVIALDIATEMKPSGRLGVGEPCGYYRFVQMSSGQWLALRSEKEEDLLLELDFDSRKKLSREEVARDCSE